MRSRLDRPVWRGWTRLCPSVSRAEARWGRDECPDIAGTFRDTPVANTSGRILVAYATRLGSTIGAAEAIGRALRAAGAETDVCPVAEVHDLAGYDALVLGSAIRVGKPLPELTRFVEQHTSALADRPVAYFAVCGTLQEDSPGHRETVLHYLDPLRRIKEPVSIGLFAGAFDYGKVSPLLRWLLKAMRAPEGDWRNWDQIQAWATDLAPRLTPTTSSQPQARAEEPASVAGPT